MELSKEPATRRALQDSKDESIGSNNSGPIARGGSAEIHDRTGLYISILALALAGISLGLWLNQSQVIDARVQVGVAEAKVAMQQQASDAKSDAISARQNARIALDEVERIREALAVKGIVIPKH